MKTETTVFDPADHLDAEEDQIDLLLDAFASGDVAYINNAMGAIVRARHVSKLRLDPENVSRPLPEPPR